jgi:NAD(P)-dependent dehydrogenase (short-subunit alcohol dehydrogenase family)
MNGNDKPRTWLITGVNSGFGRHMTQQLLERGDRVAGTVRKMDAINDLKQKYGNRLWLAHLDMTNPAEIRTVVSKAFGELGRIDVLVSNAGYGLFGAAEELSDEQVAHQLATNLIGPIHLVRAALPHLRAQGGGRIIGLSTYGGQAALPGGSLYHASKWGLEGFLESIAQELSPFRIGVTIVEPGGARTNFRFGGAQLGTQMEAYHGTPAAMVHAMIKDTSRLPNGDPAKMVRIVIDSADEFSSWKCAKWSVVLDGVCRAEWDDVINDTVRFQPNRALQYLAVKGGKLYRIHEML